MQCQYDLYLIRTRSSYAIQNSSCNCTKIDSWSLSSITTVVIILVLISASPEELPKIEINCIIHTKNCNEISKLTLTS